MKNMMKDNSLFFAIVTAVYPNEVSERKEGTKNVIRDSYTIDIKPTTSHRGLLINVPVVRLDSGGHAGTGTTLMPSEGDLVVCGYIEGFNNFPVCLGTITNKFSQTVSRAGNNRHDYTFHHKSGNYIQMRGKEINIQHTSGTKISINASGEVLINTSTLNLKTDTINIDSGLSEALIKGKAFKSLYEELQQAFDMHTHTGNIGVPTSPPVGVVAPVFEDTLLT